jgi:hypothetical protein
LGNTAINNTKAKICQEKSPLRAFDTVVYFSMDSSKYFKKFVEQQVD